MKDIKHEWNEVEVFVLSGIISFGAGMLFFLGFICYELVTAV